MGDQKKLKKKSSSLYHLFIIWTSSVGNTFENFHLFYDFLKKFLPEINFNNFIA